MKKFSCLVVVLCMFISTAAMAATNVTQDMLMEMSEGDRNNVINALNRAKDKKADEIAAIAESTKNTAEEVLESTTTLLDKVDITQFEEKSLAIAKGINTFFKELGVTINEFITTPAGNMIIFGVLYKLGVFGSFWAFAKGSVLVFVLVILLYGLNTRKTVTLTKTETRGKDELVTKKEVRIPRISAVFSDDADEHTTYSVIGSIICLILLVVTVINM